MSDILTFRVSWFWRSSWIRDCIELHADRVIVIRRRWLGLVRTEDEILFKRISSVKLQRGLFTASIFLETSGGSNVMVRITRLRKDVAKKVIGIIRAKIE
jgi:hypothetical protein